MFPFHSIILWLLAATCCGSTDVTCGGRFPKAGDGFARRPDGCSSWSDNPEQVPDKFGSANFGGVCDEHDRCYYTIGANVDQCNSNFCGGLRNACDKAYCRTIPVFGWTCVIGVHQACTAIAEAYCAAVRLVAADVYGKAQDLQKEYDTCIAGNGGLPSVLCSNGKPHGARWKERFDGTKCFWAWYLCLDGKITMIGEPEREFECIETT